MPLVSTLLDLSAALMNDTQKQTYTYAAQLPYFEIALDELEQIFARSNIPSTNETSAVIQVDAGVVAIGFATTPALPTDLISVVNLWEGTRGSDSYTPMSKRNFLSPSLSNISNFGVYTWNGQEIGLPSSIRNNDLKLDYIRSLFQIVDENSTIDIINAHSFLYYRTASLCAEFIGEDKPRAENLNGNAAMALDLIEGIENKAKQNIFTRRRPFRAGYKGR